MSNITHTLNGGRSLKANLLWKNQYVETFNYGNVNLVDEFTNYDFLLVEFSNDRYSTNVKQFYIKIDENQVYQGSISATFGYLLDTGKRIYRCIQLTYYNTYSANFTQCWWGDGVVLSTGCIPLKIYGIKGKINGIEK